MSRGPRRPLLAAALAALVLSACAAQTDRVAPFRDRQDSTDAGALRGPFTGQVVDAETGSPVSGAVVYASWSFTSGYGEQLPAGARDHTTSTDEQGRYAVPEIDDVPAGVRLSGAYLVVYKPGYVAYRSDRRFSDLGLRRDFVQRHNDVALARWRPEHSHVEHVRFIGGGEALVELTADERARAAAELAGEPILPPEEPEAPIEEPEEAPTEEPEPDAPPVPASELLTPELVEAVTGDSGPFEQMRLDDQPDTATYSSQHLRAEGRPEAADAALRLWAEGAAASRARFEALEASLPAAEEHDPIGDRSIVAVEPGVIAVVFADFDRGLLALLTCGAELCPTPDVAEELARGIHRQIADDGEAPAEASPAPEDEGEQREGEHR